MAVDIPIELDADGWSALVKQTLIVAVVATVLAQWVAQVVAQLKLGRQASNATPGDRAGAPEPVGGVGTPRTRPQLLPAAARVVEYHRVEVDSALLAVQEYEPGGEARLGGGEVAVAECRQRRLGRSAIGPA